MGTYALTGGATGIGAAIRRALAAAGHTLIVVDLKDADIVADLSTAAGRQAALDGIRARAPQGLDGFVPCAGVAGHVPDHALVASLNYFGTVDLVEGLRPLLAARKGAVVLISSNSAPMETSDALVDAMLAHDEPRTREIANSIEGQWVYAGSKRAVARWMRRKTREYAKEGIRINAVAPGYTETPMTAAVAKDPQYGEAIRQFLASIPLGRAGQPEDIANAVQFLLGPASSFVSGSVLFVDGGHDAMLRPDAL